MRETAVEFVAQDKVGFASLGRPPAPGRGEVLIETRYTGITNGTERHALLFEHGFGGKRYPSRHGYQHVGQVAALGEGVERYAEGDWVYYGDYVGHRGWNLVPENEELLARLPAGLDPADCALLGVAGVALRGVRRLRVATGHRVWVVGLGPIGQFTAQAAQAVGAQVVAGDLLPNRLATARAAGITALDAGATDYAETLMSDGPYDFIYDCCSLPRLFFDIFERKLLAYGGTVAAMAVRDEATFPWALLHHNQARIEVSCHFDGDDLRVLLFLCASGKLQIKPVVSHRVPIAEAPEMYRLLSKKPQELLGVIFTW